MNEAATKSGGNSPFEEGFLSENGTSSDAAFTPEAVLATIRKKQ